MFGLCVVSKARKVKCKTIKTKEASTDEVQENIKNSPCRHFFLHSARVVFII